MTCGPGHRSSAAAIAKGYPRRMPIRAWMTLLAYGGLAALVLACLWLVTLVPMRLGWGRELLGAAIAIVALCVGLQLSRRGASLGGTATDAQRPLDAAQTEQVASPVPSARNATHGPQPPGTAQLEAVTLSTSLGAAATDRPRSPDQALPAASAPIAPEEETATHDTAAGALRPLHGAPGPENITHGLAQSDTVKPGVRAATTALSASSPSTILTAAGASSPSPDRSAQTTSLPCDADAAGAMRMPEPASASAPSRARSMGRAAAAELSPREREVLRGLRDGLSNKQIARVLQVSENTVKTHLANVYAKLGVGRRTEALRVAQERGLG